jgi:hypothetical protein
LLPGIQQPARQIATWKPNLYGGALNGRSEIRSISPSSVQATADLLHSASDFRIARSVRMASRWIGGKAHDGTGNQIIGASITCRSKKPYVHATMKNDELLDAKMEWGRDDTIPYQNW